MAEDQTVRLWDTGSGAQKQVLSGHTAIITSVAFSRDGKLVASGDYDGSIRLWNLGTGTTVRTFPGHVSLVYALDFSPDNRLLASAGADATARLWEVATGKPKKLLRGHVGPTWGASFSPGGRLLATSGADGTARIWEVGDGKQKTSLGPMPGRLYSCKFLPDGKRIAFPVSDGTARICPIDGHECLVIRGHNGEVNKVVITPDGKLAATSSDDGTVRTWNADTGAPFWRGPALVSAAAMHAKGAAPWLLSHLGWTPLGEAAAGAPTPAELPATAWRTAVEKQAKLASESPDHATLCVQTADRGLELWDLGADKQVRQERIDGLEQVLGVPEGCLLLTRPEGSEDGKAVLMPRTGPARDLATRGKVTAIGSADRRLFVAAGNDIFAFDPSGQPLGQPRTVGAGVSAIALGPSASFGTELLLVGFRDGNVELWPLAPGEAKRDCTPEGTPSSPVQRIVAGPMQTFVAAYGNGLVGLWSAQDGALLHQSRLHGSVIHLELDAHALYAATDLGQSLSWDLGLFYADSCELLRQIWQRVPVVWENGQAVAREPPRAHPCAVGAERRP